MAMADRARGVYMISVAAELAGMHPQTLRIYESRGLITPQRSPKNTRLYSDEDVERLRRIQELTTELGMNLAGVERVFELEQELERMQRRMRNLERAAERHARGARGRDRARAPRREGRAGALRAAGSGAHAARCGRARSHHTLALTAGAISPIGGILGARLSCPRANDPGPSLP